MEIVSISWVILSFFILPFWLLGFAIKAGRGWRSRLGVWPSAFTCMRWDLGHGELSFVCPPLSPSLLPPSHTHSRVPPTTHTLTTRHHVRTSLVPRPRVSGNRRQGEWTSFRSWSCRLSSALRKPTQHVAARVGIFGGSFYKVRHCKNFARSSHDFFISVMFDVF